MSHGSRCAPSTFPECKSVANKKSSLGSETIAVSTSNPSVTSTRSDQLSALFRVCSFQYAISADRGRNPWGGGFTHMRLKIVVTIRSCSVSGIDNKGVPGSHCSSSMAFASWSHSKSLTVPRPSQNRRPSASCSPSIWGIPSFSTARVPSARMAGATHEQLTYACPYGAPRESDQRRWRARTVVGSTANQALRSGVFAQCFASRVGMTTDITDRR